MNPDYATHPAPSTSLRIVRRLVLFLVFIMLMLTGILIWPWLSAKFLPLTPAQSAGLQEPFASQTATPSPTLPLPPTEPPASSNLPITIASPADAPAAPAALTAAKQGTVFLSVAENGYSHLFAYRPPSQPLVRLTDGPWNDITPALSPDGTRLAFASNRSGHWDLYQMILATGDIERLTDTPAYDASPTWSPDGLWMAYESYTGDGTGGLDIYIRALNEPGDPIRLTDDPGADSAPVWSPLGRELAFVSTRSGESEIWLARLDQVDERFVNLSRNAVSCEGQPAWSPDGLRLAWSARPLDGIQTLTVWDSTRPDERPIPVGGGAWPAWNPQGTAMIGAWQSPNQIYLSGFELSSPGLVLPPLPLPGSVQGMTWGNMDLPATLPEALAQAAQATPQPLWAPAFTTEGGAPNGRLSMVPLEDVDAASPVLQDMVDESYQALRQRLAAEIGWDFLSSLENAFVPLTSPLMPGMNEDWLYTGRAFSFNPAPMSAGWLVVAREDYGPEVYWRVYLRTRFQDGSQGQPLHAVPWNLNARYQGDARAYEQGGAPEASIPDGYWYDFTSLAAVYGWERLPALLTWRSSYPAARFNEYVHTGRLDWFSAMQEVYPKEALDTPTPIPPPTQTPTATLRPTRTPYMSPTPRPTRTPRPTSTPIPSITPTATLREHGSLEP